ncbi:MAG: GNAT family N-acetyltransferase [Bacteroidales bacterium]|nr:GNAT family N-acetyltransferase [Bacteroidales bacterium]
MTEKEKMLAGQFYSAVDPDLSRELMETREIIHEYNALRPSETRKMKEILHNLFDSIGDDDIIVNQPFHCDYGKQIRVGKRFFANFNFTILDEARVTIGDDCFIGPNVSIYTACHSTDPVERNSRIEWARPVTIGDNVWIGGSVTILPGVTIGNDVTIGAGSAVVADIPSGSIAVGNPCKVIKSIHNDLRTVKITSSNIDNVEFRSLYESAFPPEEQIPYDDIKELMKTIPIDFTVYYDQEKFVGLTMVLKRQDFDWGWYFAVCEELRGKGYGQMILSSLIAQHADQPMVIDIESPAQKDCPNLEQRLRRYNFYKRNGFKDTPTAKSFEGIDYTIMLLGEGEFTQENYDEIIDELRQFWENLPSESQAKE